MKEIVIIAGPNGSGKTTLAGQLNLSVQFVNADMYERALYSHIADRQVREQRAGIAMTKKLQEKLKQGDSFAFETVFAAYRIPQFLRKAKADGYKIYTHFVATEDVHINVARVAQRVTEGGHDVPVQKIFERYVKSLTVLPELFAFSDEAILYDNTSETMRPFLAKEKGQVKVLDDVPKWAEPLVKVILK